MYFRSRKPISIILLIFTAVTIGLGQSATIEQREYAVYSFVLRSIYLDNRKNYSGQSHFVLIDKTTASTEPNTPAGRKYIPLIREFERRNQKVAMLEKRLATGMYSETYYLVSKAKIDSLFEDGKRENEKQRILQEPSRIKIVDLCGSANWKPFYELFPEAAGYYTMSRVAFINRFAMVEVDRHDACSGFTRTYILRETKGKWIIVETLSSEWIV